MTDSLTPEHGLWRPTGWAALPLRPVWPRALLTSLSLVALGLVSSTTAPGCGNSLLSQHLGEGRSQVILRVQGLPGVHEALSLKKEAGRKETETIP